MELPLLFKWYLLQPIPSISRVALSGIPDDIQIWSIDLLASDGDSAVLNRVLDNTERARAARFKGPHLTRRFVVSRSALRILLAKKLAIAPQSVHFQYGPHGKPALADDLASSGITFNLSHSGDAALIGIAHNRQIGVDVESALRTVEIDAVSQRFFAPAEYAWLQSLPEDQRQQAFYRCWTAKESYLKARGDGLSVDLTSFEILPNAGQTLRLTVYDDASESDHWRVAPLSVPSPYVATLTWEADSR